MEEWRKLEKLGDRVKSLREKLNLRPEHLAIALNVSTATIYNLESNKSMIRADRIIPLAKALKVTPDALLGYEEEESEVVGAGVL
jgi:transcriptional regulator with XRE-family HTH domain